MGATPSDRAVRWEIQVDIANDCLTKWQTKSRDFSREKPTIGKRWPLSGFFRKFRYCWRIRSGHRRLRITVPLGSPSCQVSPLTGGGREFASSIEVGSTWPNDSGPNTGSRLRPAERPGSLSLPAVGGLG